MKNLRHFSTSLLFIAASCAAFASGSQAPGIGGDEALARLIEGNKHFVAGQLTHPGQSVERRVEVSKGQHPFAIVLTCADSRLSPEIYFDQGLGDLFVVRNAGNILDDHTLGSIEYAVEHLGARLIIVVGHSKCGAVAAACAGGHAPGHIHSIVEDITPAVEASKGQPGDAVDNAVRANALRMAEILSRVEPIIGNAASSGKVKVVAARYDLASGVVEIL